MRLFSCCSKGICGEEVWEAIFGVLLFVLGVSVDLSFGVVRVSDGFCGGKAPEKSSEGGTAPDIIKAQKYTLFGDPLSGVGNSILWRDLPSNSVAQKLWCYTVLPIEKG